MMKNLYVRLMHHKRLAILALAILVAIIYVVVSRSNQKPTGNKHTVKRRTLEDVLSFSGQIDAADRATLVFQTGGRLAYIGVHEGDHVKKGQLLASLDQRQVKTTLQKYLNTYSKERLDFDNQKQKYDERALPADKYLRQDLIDAFSKAQYDLNNTVLDVELQDLSLQYSSLVSPIDGVVTSSGYKTPGTNVVVTQAGIEIVNPQTLYFSAAADQTEVTKLHEGMESQIEFDSYPDDRTRGTIQSIAFSPKEGETGTVYEVKISLADIDLSSASKYRLGMTGDTSFVLRKHDNVMAVPSTYVYSEGTTQYVYRYDGSKLIKTPITVVDTIDIYDEISGGLSEGDVIYDKTQ